MYASKSRTSDILTKIMFLYLKIVFGLRRRFEEVKIVFGLRRRFEEVNV